MCVDDGWNKEIESHAKDTLLNLLSSPALSKKAPLPLKCLQTISLPGGLIEKFR